MSHLDKTDINYKNVTITRFGIKYIILSIICSNSPELSQASDVSPCSNIPAHKKAEPFPALLFIWMEEKQICL